MSLIAARSAMVGGGGKGGVSIIDSVFTNATQYSSNWTTSYPYVGAYIDTGYKVNPQTTIEVECGWNEYQAQSWDSPIGSGANGVWNGSLVAIFPKWDHPMNPYGSLLNKSYAESGSVSLQAPTEIIRFLLGPQDGFKFWTESGTLLYSENPKTPPSSGAKYSLYIGATNYGGTMVNPMIGRIRRVTLSENGTTVKNYLSAKFEGVCGFFETVGGVFSSSESSIAFTEVA